MDTLDFIREAFKEDIGNGDHTTLSCIPESAYGKAHLLVKEEGVLAGVELAMSIFNFADDRLNVTVVLNDGSSIHPGDIAFYVEGPTRSILTSERLVLNCMQRMSGIATATQKLNQLLIGTKTKILDTRKTTPNFREMEKWAVRIGGGVNHRFGLYDMIMIKDNHIDYAGGISKAVTACRNYLKDNNLDLKIEVEARNLEEVKEVLFCDGVFRIMLDNFKPEELSKAVQLIDGKLETEASGGITEKNIREYAQAEVDFISVGAITHTVKSLDLSLKAI